MKISIIEQIGLLLFTMQTFINNYGKLETIAHK